MQRENSYKDWRMEVEAATIPKKVGREREKHEGKELGKGRERRIKMLVKMDLLRLRRRQPRREERMQVIQTHRN